jgi:hypothetical protein
MNPNGDLVTADNFEVAPNLGIFTSTSNNGFIESMEGYNPDYLPIKSSGVLAKIRAGRAGWESMVSPDVAKIIKQRQLFGYQPELVAKN